MIEVKTWIIDTIDVENDVKWYNANSHLRPEVIPATLRDVKGYDSGWCDASTGAQIVVKGAQIRLTTTNQSEEAWMLLKFGKRAILERVECYES